MKKDNYFISRNAQFYGFFAHRAWYVRCGITIAALALFFLIWYTTSYRMLDAMYAASSAAVERVIKDQRGLMSAQEAGRNTAAAVLQLQEQYQRKVSALCAAQPEIKEILALVKNSGLILQLYAPQEPVSMQEGYTKEGVRIDVVGTYEAIISFVEACTLSSVASYVHCQKHQHGLLASFHICWYDIKDVREETE